MAEIIFPQESTPRDVRLHPVVESEVWLQGVSHTEIVTDEFEASDDLVIFDPLSLNPDCRWRASEGTYQGIGATATPAAVGNPVGTWVDEIAGVQFGATNTGSRPLVTLIGSTRVITHDGIDDTLVTALEALGIVDDCTLIAIASYPSINGRYVLDRANTGNIRRVYVRRNGGWAIYSSGGALLTAPGPSGNAGWGVVAHTVSGHVPSVYVDGVLADSDTQDRNYGINDLRTGANLNPGGYSDTSIAEILVWSRGLDPAEITAMQSYAHAIYGTDLSIPAAPGGA